MNPVETYLRFVTDRRVEGHATRSGVFSAAYDLRRSGTLDEAAAIWLDGVLAWFDAQLKSPARARLRLPPSSSERAAVVYWVKASAHEHVTKLFELVAMLRQAGVPCTRLRSSAPGRIVYDDAHQIGAIPFRDGPR